MKLAFVIFRYFPHGGLQKDFLSIAKEAIARGNSVTAFVAEQEGDLPFPVCRLEVNGRSNHSRMKDFEAKVHTALREEYPGNCGIRTCLLTNASELHRKEVRSELKNLDLIVPSLDGSNEEEFRLINRPHKDVTLAKTLEGCITFRKEYPTIEMWLEVFIVPGINDTPESLPRFVELFRQIKPDKIQLNSLDRRGAVDWIQVPAREEMEKIADCFQNAGFCVEIVGKV